MFTTVRVLGIGTLISNPIDCNTSFLVKRTLEKNRYEKELDYDSWTLIDCGYNVFPTLLSHYENEIKNIRKVFVTHNHADHIGSLGHLIYYRWFKYNYSTEIITGEDNKKPLAEILSHMVTNVGNPFNPSYRDFSECPYKFRDFNEIGFSTFKVDHCNMPAYGLMYNKDVIFTGDTDVLNPDCKYFQDAKIIFHDSNFHQRIPSVHAYIDDILKYPKNIQEKIRLVHHGLNSYHKVMEVQYKYQDSGIRLVTERDEISVS